MKRTICILLFITCFIGSPVVVNAASINMNFDHVYYANTYPDLKEQFGYDYSALYQHYINNGQYELCILW